MYRRLLTLLYLTAISAAAVAQQTFVVNDPGDGDDGDPGNGVTTLREAVALAEADAVADVIAFDAALAGQTITLGGELVITESLTVDGGGAAGVTVSGGWDGIYDNTPADGFVGTRIFNLPGGGNAATRNFTLRSIALTRANPGADNGGANADQDSPASGAGSANGGCVFMNGGTLIVDSTTMSFSTGNDGAFVEIVDGTAAATASTFFSARGRDDGAVFDIKAGAIVSAVNCTFYDNQAGFGGPYANGREGSVARNDGTLELEHCTVAYNLTEEGGTIDNRGPLTVENCLFVLNQSLEAGQLDINNNTSNSVTGTVTNQGGNYTTSATTGPLAGFTAVTADGVKLGVLADNGGPTPTLALDCTSSVYEVISPSQTFDQRGVVRGGGGASEPGAYEVDGCPNADGDADIDFVDFDDDNDGTPDTTEASFAASAVADLGLGAGANPTGNSYDANGTTLSFDTVNADPAGYFDVRVESGVQGTTGLRIVSNPTTPAAVNTLAIDFADPVYGLTFDLAGLDSASAASDETVAITLFYRGQSFSLADGRATVGANVTQLGNQFSADADVAEDAKTGTQGLVSVADFPFPVDRIEIGFSNGTVTGDPVGREFFLSGLTFRDPSALDPDGDGLPAPLDLDADGDGIVDNVEQQPTTTYDAAATGVTPVDTDADGTPDFLDADADDDGEADAVEGHDTNNDGVVDAADAPVADAGLPSGVDADGDGIDDGYDNDDAAANPTNGTPPTAFPDSDNSGDDRDWRDDDANIAGFAFDDLDGDGLREGGEAPIPGVTVLVFDAADLGTALDSATTEPDGSFLFPDFNAAGAPGEGVASYVLQFRPVDGFEGTVPQDVGANDRVDSDYDPVTLRTASFAIDESSPAAFLGGGFTATPLAVAYADVRADCATGVSFSIAEGSDPAEYVVERRTASGTWEIADAAAPGGGYYRVVGVEADGRRTVSPTVYAAPCASAATLSAYPNPASAGGGVTVATDDVATPLSLLDLAGRAVRTVVPRDVAGGEVVLRDLAPGLYLLRQGDASVKLVVR